MTLDTTEEKRILPTVTLEESYRLCDSMVSKKCNDYRWMYGNLPKPLRKNVHSILALLIRSAGLCDIHMGKIARVELLVDFREDMRNNFMEEESTDQFPALLDTMKRFDIPQQYLHDIVSSADMCTHIDRFQSFDQWLQLGCRLGGGTLLSLIPVIGAERQGYESAAMACGQAVYLTHLLADIADEIQKLEYFLPEEDLKQFDVDLKRHNPAKPEKSLLRLIRFEVERIEKLFVEGGQVVNYMGLDGQRIMKSVVSVFWNLLMKIKLEPEKLLMGEGNLTRKERFRFKLKHVLGLEGGVSVLPDESDDHGHH